MTISNGLSTFIYAPPDPYCSIVSVQQLDAGERVAKDSCAAEGPAPDPPSVIAIPPKSKTWGRLAPEAQRSRTQGPILGKPVTPFVSEGNLRALPLPEAWKPGDPIPEIPEGGKRPPFSALDRVLEPGTYRIEFTFTVGTVSGPVQTVHAKEFTVTD